MTPEAIAKTIEIVIVVAGIAAIFWAVFKNGTTTTTIKAQRELIDTLTNQVKELRTLHIDNEKAISKLQGQVDVYKELPLSELATSMKSMAETQERILKHLKKEK